MRIALDLSCLTPDKVTGIGVYAENLSKALVPLAKVRKSKVEGWIPWRKRKLLANVTSRTPLPINIYNEATRWWNPPNVFHGPDFKIPAQKKFRRIVTIHDLVEFETEFGNSDFMRNAQKQMRKMLYHCQPDHIICISDFTMNRFRHFFPDLKIPMTRIYHGVDHRPGPQPFINRLQPNPYILSVGTLETRKNAGTLIHAFEIMKVKTQSKLDLVLAGGLGNGHEAILRQIQASPQKNSIRIMSSVSQNQLLSLYQHAETFILPSLYEGFGFPVLEAMKMGVPVITSEIGALKEIAGSAALLVNPRNPASIAAAYEGLCGNASLRRDLIDRGFEHATNFTWQKTARETFEVYERVYQL